MKTDYDPKKFTMDSYGNLYPIEKCKKHPRYKIIRQPKSSCRACWLQWWEKQLNNTTNVKMPKGN